MMIVFLQWRNLNGALSLLSLIPSRHAVKIPNVIAVIVQIFMRFFNHNLTIMPECNRIAWFC